MPPDPLTLVVLLHVDPDHHEEYERFETAAVRIMDRHGGRVERRIALHAHEEGAGAGRPDEVHVVMFPSEERLRAYTSDPELRSLGDLRARAIRHTEIWHGRDLPPPDPTLERT